MWLAIKHLPHCAALLVGMPCVLQAQIVIHVDASAGGMNDGSSWNDAFLTVQDALDLATTGDQVWIAAGVYHPDDVGTPGDRNSSFVLKDGVEVYGGFAGHESVLSQRDFLANQSILSGDLLSNDVLMSCSADAECAGLGERCWHGSCILRAMIDDNSFTVVLAEGVSSATVLDGLSIIGGRANGPPSGDEPVRERYGAGMYILFEDAPTLIPSEPVIRNCRFEWNTAAVWGGAIFVQAHPSAPDGPHIQSCLFSRNSSFDAGPLALPLGGAICSFDTDTRVEQCTFELNAAVGGFGGAGGAIGTQNIAMNVITGRFPALKIDRCLFAKNLTDGFGGAMYDSHNDTVFTNCEFVENRAGTGGGYANVGGTPAVVNSIFVGNAAMETSQILSSSSGGGLAMPASDQDQEATIANCLFFENIAMDMGGGVYWQPLRNPAGHRTIVNTIVRDNTSVGGANQVTVDGPVELAPEVTFCNIEGGWTNVDCPPGFPTCNLDADPLFTSIVERDFHIEAGSPCIDAGDNDIVLSLGVDTDAQGTPRRQDDLDTADTGRGEPPIVDIGPFERPSGDVPAIPTSSTWGVVMMALVLLIVGTIELKQISPHSTHSS